MYKVQIYGGDNKKAALLKEFAMEIGEEGADALIMSEISDYLYDLDIPFDVDEDGDMVIDDILMAVSEGEPVEETFREKGRYFRILGKSL